MSIPAAELGNVHAGRAAVAVTPHGAWIRVVERVLSEDSRVFWLIGGWNRTGSRARSVSQR